MRWLALLSILNLYFTIVLKAIVQIYFLGKLEVVKLLINHKADVNLLDNDGKTTLHRAAESQNKDICEIIASSCPHLKTMEDFRGRKPMDYAKSEELANYLRVS